MIPLLTKGSTPFVPRTAGLAVVALALLTASHTFAQFTKSDSAAGGRASFSEHNLAQAITQNEDLLRKYPDQDFTPVAMFQLCELYVRRSTMTHQKNMATYEAELKRFDAGELQSEPLMPCINFHEAIDLADQILEKYPTANFTDKVLYRLALCHREEGNQEMSHKYLERLVTEHPSSKYALECFFRLGEHYFDKRRYDLAIEAYSKLLNRWDNPFFDMTLYKLGWSYYNLNDYAKAISTFIFLIDDINKVSAVKDAAPLGKTKVDLRKEALQYIAVCFAEFGGAKKAEEFFTEVMPASGAGPAESEYTITVFLKLADIYRSRNDYEASIATLETILRRWPMHVEAPQLQNKIVENYLRSDNPARAEAAREMLVKNYGPGSVWLNHYSRKSAPPGASEARSAALALVEETLYILATDAQARGQKDNLERDYLLAIDRYGEYLEKFPQSPAAAKIQYYQAECYYDIQAFAQAAEAYQKVVINYPASEFTEQAAYNRLLAHVEEINRAPAIDSVNYMMSDFLGAGEKINLRVPNQAYAKLLNACNDFSKYPMTSEKLPEILMKYGETLYNLEQFELSRRVYAKVATELPPNKFVLPATAMVAQCAFRMENYLDAEKWYRTITTDFPDSTRHVARAQKMIASAQFKFAENLKAKGDTVIAAQAFEHLASSSHDAEIAERSLIEAAALFEKDGNKAQAMVIYELLYEKFPASERADEALFKAGQLAEDLNDWQRAVQNYLTLANTFPDSAHAPPALFHAGQCYENTKDLGNAIITFRRYTQIYRNEPSQLLEAIATLGALYYQQGQLHWALREFQETISTYRQFLGESKPVEEYLPAQAQFMIGEIHFQSYRQIELVPPVDRNFQKKQALFNQVLTAYRDAADYQVAEWTTAASYKIGATFEEFCRAFVEAPRPAGLTAADLTRYEESLQQKVRPFKERALETYNANLRLAEENNVQNEWVENSRKRAQALALELGLASLGAATTSSANGTVNTTN